MKKILMRSMVAVFAIVLTGCSGGNEGPGAEAIRDAYLKKYGAELQFAGVEVGEFEIIASENVGTEVIPRVQARVSAEFTLLQNLYERTRRRDTDGKPIITLVEQAGSTRKFTAVAVSTLKGEAWNIQLSEASFDRDIEGDPIAYYDRYPNGYVIE